MILTLKDYGEDGKLSVAVTPLTEGAVVMVVEYPAGLGAWVWNDGVYHDRVFIDADEIAEKTLEGVIEPLLQEAIRACEADYALYKSMPQASHIAVVPMGVQGQSGLLSVTYSVEGERVYAWVGVINTHPFLEEALYNAAQQYVGCDAFRGVCVTPRRETWADVEQDVENILALAGLTVYNKMFIYVA